MTEGGGEAAAASLSEEFTVGIYFMEPFVGMSNFSSSWYLVEAEEERRRVEGWRKNGWYEESPSLRGEPWPNL